MRLALPLSAILSTFGLLVPVALPLPAAEAGGPYRRRDRQVIETVDTRPENRLAPSPMLGTFRPTPYIRVGGGPTSGGGYSPLGFYGPNTSMVLYGPFSALRATAAPVSTVVRGYDGVPKLVEGTSFSTPFMPELSPVRYPTRATNYDAIRGVPPTPRTPSGYLWIDQN